MAGASPDVVPGLEAYVAVLLSYIITRRRRAAAHRARLEPSPMIVKSHPWERGFTVEGRAANKHRGGRVGFMQQRLCDLTDAQFVRRYKVGKRAFFEMEARLRPVLEPQRKYAILSSGSPVPTDLQLSMTLRMLAGTLSGTRDTVFLPFSRSPPPTTPRAARR